MNGIDTRALSCRRSRSSGRVSTVRPGRHGVAPRSLWCILIWLAYLAVLGAVLGALVAASLAPGDVGRRYLALVTVPTFREALVRTHLVATASTLIVAVLGGLFLLSWRRHPLPGLEILLRAPILLHGFP